jgi:hypothetical protein
LIEHNSYLIEHNSYLIEHNSYLIEHNNSYILLKIENIMKNPTRNFKAGLIAIIVMTFSSLTSLSRSTNNYNWSRYQIILDKKPFSSLGGINNNTNSIPDYAKKLRLSAIARIGNRVYAGFVSSGTNSFMLREGETNDSGIVLEKINYQDEFVLLHSSNEVTSLFLQSDPNLTNAFTANASTNNPWANFFREHFERRSSTNSVPNPEREQRRLQRQSQ